LRLSNVDQRESTLHLCYAFLEIKGATMTSVISDELLQECYQISAAIVSQHGEKYLPIFERFHKEVLLRQSKNMLIQTAKNIAGSFGE